MRQRRPRVREGAALARGIKVGERPKASGRHDREPGRAGRHPTQHTAPANRIAAAKSGRDGRQGAEATGLLKMDALASSGFGIDDLEQRAGAIDGAGHGRCPALEGDRMHDGLEAEDGPEAEVIRELSLIHI